MPFSGREAPTNLVDWLQARTPLDPTSMRAHYPAWMDDDVRQNLEQVIMAEPASKQAGSSTAPSAGEEYQRMLASLAQEVRAKQYAIQHRSSTSSGGGGHSREDSRSSTPRPHPPPSPAAPASLSASPHASSSAAAAGTGGRASGSSRRPQTLAPGGPEGPRAISPRKSVLRSASAKGARAAGAPAGASGKSQTKLVVSPPAPHQGSAVPVSPRGVDHSSMSVSSSSVAPSGTINVPLQWFTAMEAKLSHLATLGGEAGEQADKAAELQRLKYAMLVSKLEEMNRLHREVLAEEHQKQHLSDLEQLQKQHLREFHARLEQAQQENRRLVEEREAERRRLTEERELERQAQVRARENERVVLDRWSTEKDQSIEQLRNHFIEREKLLIEAHRTAEAAWQEQRAAFHAQSLSTMQDRDAERRALEEQRREAAKQVQQGMEQVRVLQEQLNARTLALETTKRELEEVLLERTRLQSKTKEAAERMEVLDALQTKLHRLQLDRTELLSSLESKERYWKDREEDLLEREKRLERRAQELEERERQRREARQRERREQARLGVVGAAGGSSGSGAGAGGIHRATEGEYDCAWASGPIDRKQLAVPQQYTR
jgi:hypothetical protein